MRPSSDNRIRKEIAHNAAKLVALDGLEDFLQAKKKAAQQLGVSNKRLLPSNKEIETALIEYQSLFIDNKQKLELLESRKIAHKAMQLVKEYNPRLVGPLITGTANQYSEIIIHVFSDTSEEISLLLENKSIPTSICERRLQIEKNNHVYFTSIKFVAGNKKIVLIVLPASRLKTSPIDPVTEGPMKRASLADVKALIDAE